MSEEKKYLYRKLEKKDNIIDKLKKENEKLKREMKKIKKNNEIETENYIHFNLIKKYIKIIYGFTDMVHFINEINIYGSLFENLFRKKSLKNTKLYFYFNNLDLYYIQHFSECLYNLGIVINDDYNIEQRTFINSLNNHISYWELVIKITDNCNVTFILHNNTYFDKIIYSNENITLTRTGFTIKTISNYDIKYKLNYKSLSTLDHLTSIIYNKSYMIGYEYPVTVDDLFEVIEKQNMILKKNYDIIKGYKIDEDEDSYCSICYRKHKEDKNTFLYIIDCNHVFCSNCLYKHMTTELNNRSNCPMCRKYIELTVKD